MPTVQEEILSAFYAKLSKSASIDHTTLDALRKALTSKKLKPDDFVAILAKHPPGGGQ